MKNSSIGHWLKNNLQSDKFSLAQDRIGIYFDSIFVALIILMAFFMFEPGLNSSWAILDDHELLVYSPASHPLAFTEIIPTLLDKTEINPNSTLPRFRPAYFFLRLVETRVWSLNSPFPWYLFRIFIFILFITTIFFFFKKINGRVIGALLAFLVATMNYWNGIFSRLGPAETYAILGLCFFLIGALIVIINQKSNFAWILMMFGSIIAIGSKENMIVFLVPEVYLAIKYLRKPLKSNIFPFSMVALSILWTLWIFTTVFLRIKANGSDVYENSVGLFGRLSILMTFVTQNLWFTILIGVLFLVGIGGYLLSKSKNLKPHFFTLLLGSMGIIILIISQQIFYSGTIWGRYNFPYALYLPLTISLAAYFIQQLPYGHTQFAYHLSTIAISGLILIFFTHPSNLLFIRKIANEYDLGTHDFQSTLHDIEYYLTTNPASPVIFYGSEPERDYERIISIIRYIRNDALKNDIMIFSDPPADYESTYTKLNVSLEKQLVEWSANGKPEEGIKPFKDFNENSKNCLFINFSDRHPGVITCDSVINIP